MAKKNNIYIRLRGKGKRKNLMGLVSHVDEKGNVLPEFGEYHLFHAKDGIPQSYTDRAIVLKMYHPEDWKEIEALLPR